MKLVTFVLIIVCLLVFALGCSNDNQDTLSRVIALEDALKDTENIIVDLENDLLDANNALASLDDELRGANRKIRDLEDDLTSFQEEKATSDFVKLFLPNDYLLTSGDTFQLFFRSIIQAVNPYHYYIRLSGTVGHLYQRYYEWTPQASDIGKSFPLTIDICDNQGTVLESQTTTLKVGAPSGSQTSRTVLCVGDSLTANGYWISYGYQKYLSNGGAPINFVGSLSSGYQTTVHHEGREGWQWSSFVGSYGDTPSPFNPTGGSFSFLDYATSLGYSQSDELYVLLTWNGIGGSFRNFSFYTQPFLGAKTFIDTFHEEFPNAKITLMGIPQPSVHSGLGAYYTINQSYGDNYGQFVTALYYNEFLKEWADHENYASFMRYIDVKGQFDSEYNMPLVPKAVNTQSSTTESIGSAMGMHPTTSGYLQIGDAFYRALSHD